MHVPCEIRVHTLKQIPSTEPRWLVCHCLSDTVKSYINSGLCSNASALSNPARQRSTVLSDNQLICNTFVNPEIVLVNKIPNLDMGSQVCGVPELVNSSQVSRQRSAQGFIRSLHLIIVIHRTYSQHYQ